MTIFSHIRDYKDPHDISSEFMTEDQKRLKSMKEIMFVACFVKRSLIFRQTFLSPHLDGNNINNSIFIKCRTHWLTDIHWQITRFLIIITGKQNKL